MLSKTTGWISGGTPAKMASVVASWPGGCLLWRTSLTEGNLVSLGLAGSSRQSTPPLPLFASRSKGGCVLPLNMRLANDRARCSSCCILKDFGSRCWRVLLSLIKITSSPELEASFQTSDMLLHSRSPVEWLKNQDWKHNRSYQGNQVSTLKSVSVQQRFCAIRGGVGGGGWGGTEVFEQEPCLLGRQLIHFLPAFTQAPLHKPVL